MATKHRERVVIDFEDYLRFLTSLKQAASNEQSSHVKAQRMLLDFLIESLPDFLETVTDEH